MPTLRILAVEDDPLTGEALKKNAALFDGVDITVVPTAGEGFAILHDAATSDHPFNCLLLDHYLPGMTGAEMLARLRSNGIELPAIIWSGADPEQLRRIVIETEADGFLPKPAKMEDILRVARTARKMRQASCEY
jgi:DNA-binding response OmpR family regulator